MSGDDTYILEAAGIHKKYHDGKKDTVVLKGVDLRIKKGSFVSLVGPSGAGKSTLLHILGGLDEPTQGAVTFEGSSLYALSDTELAGVRNSRIGFVFQFYHLLSEFTVLENVMMPARIGGRPGVRLHDVRERALEFLRHAGLDARLDHFPSQLSGGEKQRVAIVRSLINAPALLLCDEPTGNLDSKTGDEIFSLIRKANTENHAAVIVVTHNLELAKQSDHIYRVQDGIVVN